MKFFEGAPDFAVEVRSERNYRPNSEQAMAAKPALLRRGHKGLGAPTCWGRMPKIPRPSSGAARIPTLGPR
jgi:hypothetical protein